MEQHKKIKFMVSSIMDSHNVPLGAIQRILGHENRSTTEIYVHSLIEIKRAAMSVYEWARKKSHIDSHIDLNYDADPHLTH